MKAEAQPIDQKSTETKNAARADAELLRLFVEQHDQAAMAAIIGRHGPLVMGLCRNMLRNEHDAADAFQATFLVLLEKANSIAKAASLSSWLHGVACRVAIRARSQSMRRKRLERSGTEMTPAALPVDAADEEAISLIHEELCNLPERFRLPLVLCCLEGESREEAARQLGWTVASLKGRLERGREMLRSRLAGQEMVLSTGVLTGLLAREALAQVPASLVSSTIKATMLVATGQSLVAGAVSTHVAVLTQGVLKAMLITKLKIAGLILLAGGTAAIGSAVAVQRMMAAAPADNPAAIAAGQTALTAPETKPVPAIAISWHVGAGLVGFQQVREELKLTNDQMENIKEAALKHRKNILDKLNDPDFPLKERKGLLDELAVRVRKFPAKDFLDADQAVRFRQMQLWVMGHKAFSEPDVAEKLKLTEPQKNALKTIDGEFSNAIFELTRENSGYGTFQRNKEAEKTESERKHLIELISQKERECRAALTGEQNAEFDKLRGAKFEINTLAILQDMIPVES